MRASQSDLFGSTVAGKSTKAGKLDLDSLPPLPNSISTGVGQGKLSYLETLDSVETPVEIYRNVAIPPIPMIKHELDELARRKQEKEEEFKRKREEFLRAIQEQEEQAAREKEKAAREKEKAEREERRKQYRLMQIKNLREKDRVRHEKYIKHTEKKEFCYHQLSEAQEYLSTHEFEIYRYHVEKAGVWGLALPHP
ncbi:hypothetical protein G9A89_020767 [Geosiphon pyriformis]|nr:hypothetical protein G9A89_020767 [Geosiphon pyriformis]